MTTTSIPPLRPRDALADASRPDDLGPTAQTLRAPATAQPDVRAVLLELNTLLQQVSNGQLSSKSNNVHRVHTIVEQSIQDGLAAERRAHDAEDSKGGLFSDLEKAVGDVLNDAVHLRVADIVSDVKDDTVTDPQFWKDLATTGATVAKWVAVAGSIALAVGLTATGAGGPVAIGLAIGAAALTSAGAAESQFGVLEKMGVDAKTAQWVGVGLSVGGAATGVAAGFAAAATAQQAEAARALASAGAKGGDEAAQAAAQTAAHVQHLTRAIDQTTALVAASGATVSGIGKLGVAYYEREALQARADVEGADNKTQRLRHLIENIQKAMADVYGDAGAAAATIGKSMMNENRQLSALYSGRT